MLYGVVLTLLGITYTILWRHIARRKLSSECEEREGSCSNARRNLVGTLGCPFGAAVAFISAKGAVLIYLGLALFYLFVGSYTARCTPELKGLRR